MKRADLTLEIIDVPINQVNHFCLSLGVSFSGLSSGLSELLLDLALNKGRCERLLPEHNRILCNNLVLDESSAEAIESPKLVLVQEETGSVINFINVLLVHVVLNTLGRQACGGAPVEGLWVHIEDLALLRCHLSLELVDLLGLVDPLVPREMGEELIEVT